MTRQDFEDFEKNAVSNLEEIEKNFIKKYEEAIRSQPKSGKDIGGHFAAEFPVGGYFQVQRIFPSFSASFKVSAEGAFFPQLSFWSVMVITLSPFWKPTE